MPETFTNNDSIEAPKRSGQEPDSATLLEEWLKEVSNRTSQESAREGGKDHSISAPYTFGQPSDKTAAKKASSKSEADDGLWHRLTEELHTIWEAVKHDSRTIESAPSKPPAHTKYDAPTITPSDPFDGKGWHEDISPSGVDQASYGDCFFLSALASMANTEAGKQRIQDMISTNADGSYTVTFPGDRSKPVTVTKAELQNAGTLNGSTWANVLETAFLKYNHGDGGRRGINDFLPTVEDMPLLGKAASAPDALALLTGESVTTDQLGFLDIVDRRLGLGATSKDNVARDLERALADGQPVTAVTAGDWLKYLGSNSPGAIPDFHVFSVLSYDPKTETVIVRNPWGHNDDTPLATQGSTVDGVTNLGDGKLSMSLDTFMTRFSNVNMAGTGDYTSNARHIVSDIEQQLGHTGQAVVDLVQGNFGDALSDGWKAVKDSFHLASDELHLVTELGWDTASAAVHLVADGVETLADGAKTVGSVVASGAEAAWDGATAAVEAVGDGASAVVGKAGSLASDAWDTVTGWL